MPCSAPGTPGPWSEFHDRQELLQFLPTYIEAVPSRGRLLSISVTSGTLAAAVTMALSGFAAAEIETRPGRPRPTSQGLSFS
jgi:hypothetical protein